MSITKKLWIGKPSEECQLRRHDLCRGVVMVGFKQSCTCNCHIKGESNDNRQNK